MTLFESRDAIAGIEDIVTQEVDVPEWGGKVLVRGMTRKERNAFERSISVQKPSGNRKLRRAGHTVTDLRREEIHARMVVWCVVDSEGRLVFTEADVPMLNGKSAAAIERIVDVAMELSGMSNDDVEDLAEQMIEDPLDDSSSP